MIEQNENTFIKINDWIKKFQLFFGLINLKQNIINYKLGISSLILVKSLVQLKIFEYFSGNTIKLSTNLSITGRKKKLGFLKAIKNINIIVEKKFFNRKKSKFYIYINNISRVEMKSATSKDERYANRT